MKEIVGRKLIFGVERSLPGFNSGSLSIHGCGICFTVITALRVTCLILGNELMDAVIRPILLASMSFHITILIFLFFSTLCITLSDGTREHLFVRKKAA